MFKFWINPFFHFVPFILLRVIYLLKYPLRFYTMFRLNSNIINGNSFLGFKKTNVLFIHIPKCAGIALNKALYGDKGGGHKAAIEYKLFYGIKKYNKIFKFAIVRNPWDRLYSAYTFLMDGGRNEWDKNFAKETVMKFDSFESFVLNWVNDENIYIGIHFVPQFHFVYDYRGVKLVDHIGKFENLDNEYSLLMNKFGDSIYSDNLMKMNKTNISIKYKDCYTDEMIKHVGKVYLKDISYFNYSFEK